jgi:hypothetical protein
MTQNGPPTQTQTQKTHFETHLKAPLPSTRTLPTPSLNRPTNFSRTFFPKNNRLVAGSLEIRVEMVDADQARSEGEEEVSFWRTGRSCCWLFEPELLLEVEVELEPSAREEPEGRCESGTRMGL